MSAKEDALALITSFESSGKNGMWVNIAPGDVTKALRERVDKPEAINQGGSMLCGPAAFAYNLAKHQPDQYVKAVTDLYLVGTAVIGTLFIKPKTNLIFARFQGGINAADWILLASLRDSSNWLFDITDIGDLLGAPTAPYSMRSWLEGMGYTDIVDETNLFFTKDLKNLRRASRRFDRSYKVFLFINSNVLEKPEADFSVAPDHWVMLLSGVQIDGPPLESLQKLKFRLYSWGEEQDLPDGDPAGLAVPKFLPYYYGHIAFKS